RGWWQRCAACGCCGSGATLPVTPAQGPKVALPPWPPCRTAPRGSCPRCRGRLAAYVRCCRCWIAAISLFLRHDIFNARLPVL
ncbi:hypothetical protein, partial [Paenibacillus bouchesdurhonensis]|uniref:hypothetical protein n=1 Tax=Paenibacillus bouchesdurhonensis TaxID=1870990 RepID=UPI001F28837A